MCYLYSYIFTELQKLLRYQFTWKKFIHDNVLIKWNNNKLIIDIEFISLCISNILIYFQGGFYIRQELFSERIISEDLFETYLIH